MKLGDVTGPKFVIKVLTISDRTETSYISDCNARFDKNGQLEFIYSWEETEDEDKAGAKQFDTFNMAHQIGAWIQKELNERNSNFHCIVRVTKA